jgi:sigma-B regulation protein RsbU (phosphoserine phosphatase)
VVLADVSGKGMGAAMLMSSTRTVLRLVAEGGISPSDVLGRVNQVLLRDFPSAKFVTMVYALLDPKKQTVVFANAGHCLPLLVAGGTDLLTTDAGLPLGVQECSFSERTVKMTAGTRLVFYSDGVTEAMNSSLEQYGEKRLANHLAHRSSSIESLLRDVHKFRGTNSSSDDLTAVMIQAKE